jgi:hypothetical protein
LKGSADLGIPAGEAAGERRRNLPDGGVPMTRLNVENLEGRALMSATATLVSSPTVVDAAVVRVVDDPQPTANASSHYCFLDQLVSQFKANDPVSTQYL